VVALVVTGMGVSLPEVSMLFPNLVHLRDAPHPTGVHDTSVAWKDGILA